MGHICKGKPVGGATNVPIKGLKTNWSLSFSLVVTGLARTQKQHNSAVQHELHWVPKGRSLLGLVDGREKEQAGRSGSRGNQSRGKSGAGREIRQRDAGESCIQERRRTILFHLSTIITVKVTKNVCSLLIVLCWHGRSGLTHSKGGDRGRCAVTFYCRRQTGLIPRFLFSLKLEGAASALHIAPQRMCSSNVQQSRAATGFLIFSAQLDPVLESCYWIAVIYLSCVYVALWVMVLSCFSAPLITLACPPPPTCLFIPMTYSFRCYADNFDKVGCCLQGTGSEQEAGRES